ncbi:MAG: DUF4007 family protein, partial [Gammaproteobacteria bacterium]|nr:DUF4007 family protein [Gammaproteobacteria bacterium]
MALFEMNDLAPFSQERSAFGRHETFGLRYGWLTKGYLALKKREDIFISEDATVELGVGKNMVNAIRYWLQAARIIQKTNLGLEPTKIGKRIFGSKGWDPYLEDEATIWLVHWLIASNAELATAFYWFFNNFHKPEFSSQEASTALMDFVKQNIKNRTSASTVKNDAAILLRMYSRSKGNTRTPVEDALDSPLSLLGLISQAPGGRTYYSRALEREGLPIGIFGFAVAEVFNAMRVSELPIEDLMYAKGVYPAPGAVFRLTENAMLTKLERLIYQLPGVFELRETAGIHQLYMLEETDPLAILQLHYENQLQE